jgi:rhomboid protease GluP
VEFGARRRAALGPTNEAAGADTGTLSLTALMRGGPRKAPATAALIAVNIGVFAVMLAFGAGLWHSPNDVQLAWGANFGPATKDGEWWRLGSAMFLHFGLVHLAMNMWALWDCGRLVERLYGTPRLLLLYAASGLAGNLVSLVAQGDRAVSGGASGAIFGLFGALLVCLLRERRHVDPTEFRWLFWGGAAFALATLALGFFVRGIDNAAHIGGLGAGALLGIALGRPLTPRRPIPIGARLLATATLGVATALFALNIPEPRYRFGEELQARTAIRQFLDDEHRIANRWQAIVEAGRSGSASFDELAGDIEADVSKEYQDSFEQLSSVAVSPEAPSAARLEMLRRYALLRGDAAHALAEALRTQDRPGIARALDAMRRATQAAQAASASASATSAAGGASAAAASSPSAAAPGASAAAPTAAAGSAASALATPRR